MSSKVRINPLATDDLQEIKYIYEDNIISIQRILHGKRDYMTLLKEQKQTSN
jgi:plasmid stabilization system protein ParE